ncbi:MAG: glycosyltransferase family 4 protein [Candidatus Fermentibacteraceae bacterium]|nr:glycosyltransferase family 4 protein [Candidatus Fermentibacteraceae bacterium]
MACRIMFVMLGKKDFTSGGYIFNFRMVERMRSRGFMVDVVHFRTVPPGLPGNWMAASRYIRRRALDSGPDLIIISKSYQYVPLLRLSPVCRKIPVLYMMHHLEWMDGGNKLRSALYRKYAGWLLGMADKMWANSCSTRSALKELGVPEDRITVISPGFEKIPGDPPDRRGRSGPVRLLCVGGMSPRKAQDVVVKACAMLDRGSFVLELAGSLESDREYAGCLKNLIDELGMGECVIMTGNLDDGELVRAYRRADVLVHPARWEAFGMAILEGMWQGLPVVASDVAAIPELVRNGEHGILVPPGSPGELAEALRTLVTAREMRLEMGARSRETALGMSDWEDTGSRFLELVDSTIMERGSD